jgi:hypothetical protein
MFVPSKLFQPIQMFASKAGAYPSVSLKGATYTQTLDKAGKAYHGQALLQHS